MSKPSLVAALLLCAATARAQTREAPDAPPPPPSDEDYERSLIDQVTRLIVAGRSADARGILDAELRRRGLAPDGYATLAVLRRVAASLDAPAPTTSSPAPSERRSTGEAAALYAGAMTLGAGVGGWADVLGGLADPRLAVGAPLAGAGLGAVGAWLVDRGRPRRGRGAAFTAGMVVGVMGGASLGLHGLLSEGWDGKGFATATLAGGVLGAGVGLGLGALTDALPGSAAFVGSASVWGAALGGLTSVAAQSDALGVFAGIGAALGTTVSFATASRLQPTTSRVLWTNLGVVTGGLLGAGLGLLLFWEAPNWSARVATIELGMIGGGVAGWLFGAPETARGRGAAPRLGWSVHPEVSAVPGGVAVGVRGITL
ncbi:MAG: hypothetical protein R3A52_10250 [Polyangiales bacterium]